MTHQLADLVGQVAILGWCLFWAVRMVGAPARCKHSPTSWYFNENYGSECDDCDDEAAK